VAFLIALFSQAPAQDGKGKDPPKKKEEDKPRRYEDYRTYFRTPKTVEDYWGAVRFELEVGRTDLAALALRGMMEVNPTKDQLVELEKEAGMSSFLALGVIRKWDDKEPANTQARKDAQALIEAVTVAVREHYGSKARIEKFVKSLGSDDKEERSFAL